MTTQSLTPQRLGSPAVSAMRSAKRLVGWYTALSALTLGAVVLLRDDAALVTTAVWTRVIIVMLSALLTLSFTVRAARGSSRAYLRLRIVSAVMVVAIAVIIALPGSFPTWLKVEQGACGLLLLGVVALVNGPRLRSAFAR